MKKSFARVLLPLSLALLSASANADTRIMEVWACTLNDRHTMDEVKEGNSNWLRFAKKSVPDGDVRSYITTPVVGALDTFMYVDSYPGLEAWAATKEAFTTEEGQALEEALGELATCDSNRLHRREES